MRYLTLSVPADTDRPMMYEHAVADDDDTLDGRTMIKVKLSDDRRALCDVMIYGGTTRARCWIVGATKSAPAG
jgi:hypothetical protein